VKVRSEDLVSDDDETFREFLAEALALRGGKPFPIFETIDEAVKAGPFSRSGLYNRGPTGTGEIEFFKSGGRTLIRTLTRLRAAAGLPRVARKAAA
jgi:hypothetical protein